MTVDKKFSVLRIKLSSSPAGDTTKSSNVDADDKNFNEGHNTHNILRVEKKKKKLELLY